MHQIDDPSLCYLHAFILLIGRLGWELFICIAVTLATLRRTDCRHLIQRVPLLCHIGIYRR